MKNFLSAFVKGAKEVMSSPDASIDYVKARDGIINVDLESLSIDPRQVHSNQIAGFRFVNVSSRRPVGPLEFIPGVSIRAITSLRRVFEKPVHPILQHHEVLERIPLL